MKVLVVDDELLARQRIIQLLTELDDGLEIHESSSGKEALRDIAEIEPQLIFLDIQMTDMTGFDVLKQIHLDFSPEIIFVTAFDNFAVKAFEVQALDFLLKPYRKERFLESYRRAVSKINTENSTDRNVNKHRELIRYLDNGISQQKDDNYLKNIVLKLGNRYYFVECDTIKYITSSAYYAEIFTMDGRKHVHRISMTALMKKLSPKLFVRVNRSSILNINEIKDITSEGFGDYNIRMKDKKIFSLSKKYRVQFLEKMNIKGK
jgi:two-component system LytT family response regulator